MAAQAELQRLQINFTTKHQRNQTLFFPACQNVDGFFVNPSRQAARLLMNPTNLIHRKKIRIRNSSRIDAVAEIIGGLFFSQWRHMHFFDNRFGRQSCGDSGHPVSDLRLCKKDNVLKFFDIAIRTAIARLNHQLKFEIIQLVGVVNDNRFSTMNLA